MSYREGEWKYVVPRRAGNAPGEKTNLLNGELYHLTEDCSETKNVIGQYPEKAKALFQSLLKAIQDGRTRP